MNSVACCKSKHLSTNYLDLLQRLTGWAQQYLPDLWKKKLKFLETELFQDFLSQVGAEEAMTSDQVVWSEQVRLHLSYKGQLSADSDLMVLLQLLLIDIDGNTDVTSKHGVRVNDYCLSATSWSS